MLDAVLVPTDDGGSLWDPLPVTLPTYVTKPKAKRTVRTIDLNEPGTWTSGHTEQDTRAGRRSTSAGASAADARAPALTEPTSSNSALSGPDSAAPAPGWYLFSSSPALRGARAHLGLWRSW